MGAQFWWCFDLTAAVIIIISIYSSGKKGFVKSAALLVSFVVCVALASVISDKAADHIYENHVKQRNIKNIEQLLDENSLTRKTENLLEELGYSDITDESGIAAVLVQDANANKVTMDMIDELLSDRLRFYENDVSNERISKFGSDNLTRFLTMAQSGDNKAAAEYIEENYTGDISRNIIRVICFIIILFLLMILAGQIIHMFSSKEKERTLLSISNHVLGGVLGAAEGIFIVFIFAAAVRVLIALGNNEIMIFNSDTLENTIIFKHIYKLTMKI